MSKYVMKMSKEDINKNSTIDWMENIFYVLLLLNIGMSLISLFMSKASSIYQYFYSIQYTSQVGNILDLIYYPSIYVIYILLIKTGVVKLSLKEDWKEMLAWFMITALIYVVGSLITHKVEPPLSTLSAERVSAFFYRYIFNRIILFIPFMFYNKLSIKFKKTYLNILMGNIILNAFIIFYLKVTYSDFLNSYIFLTIEFFFIMLTHIPSMIRLMYDVGSKEMKKFQEKNFQLVLMSLIVIMFSMPFVFQVVDSLVEQQLNLISVVSMGIFSVVIASLIGSGRKLIKNTIKVDQE